MSTPNEPKSWRTSLVGWLTLVAAAATVIVQFINGEPFQIEPILAALAGVGLLAARDQAAHDEAE